MTSTPGSGTRTDVTMHRSDDSARGRAAARLRRFTGPERAVHHTTALLMIICLSTAACLYVPALAAVVGRRGVIMQVHIVAGFALPVPMVLGWLSRSFRADLRRLNRFTA